MDSSVVLSIVQEVQNSKVNDKKNHFEQKYPEFVKKYPGLFEMACNKTDMDMSNLNFMLSMLNKMNHENVSQYNASATVGQMLFSKYVEPNINMNKEKK
jgi:hypothetical protein